MYLRKKRVASAVIAALLLLALPACNSSIEASKQQVSVQEEQGSPGDVVQRVNGTAITRGDLAQAVKELLAQKQSSRPATPEVMRQVKREALNRLISAELLYQAAGKTEMKGIDQEVAQMVAQNRARHGSDAEFEKSLDEAGLSLPAFQELTRKELAINRFVEDTFAPQAKVSEAEAKKFFDHNRNRFKTGSSVRASHILVGVSRQAGAQEKMAAREKAQDLLQRVKEGENFGMLARDHSQCPSKVRGGDLGFLGRGEMDPGFEQAAFALKPGGISDIVETPLGFHIIKLIEKRGPRLESYETARDRILQYLKTDKILKMLSVYVAELRSRAKIESK